MSTFNENKYTKWYNNIVSNAKKRSIIDAYKETHHIVPRSIGGLDVYFIVYLYCALFHM